MPVGIETQNIATLHRNFEYQLTECGEKKEIRLLVSKGLKITILKRFNEPQEDNGIKWKLTTRMRTRHL